MPRDDLTEAVGQLLDAAETTAPEELIARAEAVRDRVEAALCEGRDIGLLNDAVVSVLLCARARQRGEAERMEECLEMGRLFLAAGTATGGND
jgi:cytidylate kinase